MFKGIGAIAIVSAGLIGCTAGAASATAHATELAGPSVRASSTIAFPADAATYAGDLKLFDDATGSEELSLKLADGRVEYSPGSTETKGTVTLTYQTSEHGEVVFNLKYTQFPVPPDPLWQLEGTLSVDHAEYTVDAWSEPTVPFDFAGDAARDARMFQIDLATDEEAPARP